MKPLAPIKMIFAIMALLLAAVGVMAQDTGKASKGSAATKAGSGASLTKAGAGRLAIVAMKREDRLQFAREKTEVLRLVQKAFATAPERDVVKDIDLRSYEKGNYLAVFIERKGTAFLELQPSGGGVQGIWVIGPNSVYCASNNCMCDMSWAGGTPSCSCPGDGIVEPGLPGSCTLQPKRNFRQAIATLNELCLAAGFEEAPEGGGPKEMKPDAPRIKKN